MVMHLRKEPAQSGCPRALAGRWAMCYYGGDGINSFALPDLRGRLPVHRDQHSRRPGVQSNGAGVAAGGDAHLPSTLTLNYIICLQGVFPDRD
jgi:microcystin-dependent protein